MKNLLIGSNAQTFATNCNKQLSSFVNKLNQNADILKKNSIELKHIAAKLVIKSQQLQGIENIK